MKGCGVSFWSGRGIQSPSTRLICGQSGVCVSCYDASLYGQTRVAPCSSEELPQFLAKDAAQVSRNSTKAGVVMTKVSASERLVGCRRRRSNYIIYLKDRIEDEDWHGGSDACNDLRELDAEIRELEDRA